MEGICRWMGCMHSRSVCRPPSYFPSSSPSLRCLPAFHPTPPSSHPYTMAHSHSTSSADLFPSSHSPLPPDLSSHVDLVPIPLPSPLVDQLSPQPTPDLSAPCLQDASAAVLVQKAYRSYRTRRQLADCAVVNERYGWWSVLEGVILRQNSHAFFAFENEDTAAKRWTRLKKKAAKVGKGLSKDEKARKLAIQHWLEAIDPRHRYGHNLKFYYDEWQKTATNEPFFYWLDIGTGKDIDLPVCQRSKLLKEQIHYLSPEERKNYEVIVDNGKLRYSKSGELVNTPKTDKWIFVMSSSGKLYVGQKKRGSFQHSSFLAGGATKAAGRLVVTEGMLELMEAHSGHYLPTEENFSDLVKVLEQLGTDLSMVTVQTVSDDMLPECSHNAGEDQADYTDQFKSNASHWKTDIGSGTEISHNPADNNTFNWCSEAGARLASLADAPSEAVTKVY